MSSVSTVYDAIITGIEANLTTRSRLPNIINPEDNPGRLLDNGYAVTFGPASVKRRNVCQLTEGRIFDVWLVNRITTHQHDSTAIGTIGKNMLEDALTLKKLIDGDNSFGGAITSFLDDSGIEFIDSERGKYFLLTVSFEAEYTENYS